MEKDSLIMEALIILDPKHYFVNPMKVTRKHGDDDEDVIVAQK